MLASAASEWTSAACQVVIATIALLGGGIKGVIKYRKRPVIRLLQSKCYDFHMPEQKEQKASGSYEFGGIEYLGAVTNIGHSVAINCAVHVDCVLSKGDDGDSWKALYFGMPLSLKWHPRHSEKDIPGDAKAFFRAISFTDGGMQANRVDVDQENVKKCFLLYEGDDEGANQLELSIGEPMTILIRVATRAHNTSKEFSDWLFVHWAGGSEVSKSNFKMRVAKDDERTSADSEYQKLLKEGSL